MAASVPTDNGSTDKGFTDHPSTAPGACVADLLCDRRPADAVALVVVEPGVSRTEHTFGELRDASRRLAGGLAAAGVGRGDRVATLMDKGADLVVTQLATWRLGAEYVPLFTAFGPEAITYRLRAAKVKVVVCDGAQRPKLADEQVHGDAVVVTTGTPKGVAVPARALASFENYFVHGLDVQPGDVYWNMADPGWAYGLNYAIVAPLTAGHATVLVTSKFSVQETWQVLHDEGVTNVASSPPCTGRCGPRPDVRLQLVRASSAGEPLNPEVVIWARTALGVPVHDHYGQTELGMVLGNHHHPDVARPVRPGSMGQELPGWSAAVLADESDEIAGAGVAGRVAIDVPASPLMWFTGYLDRPEATTERFRSDGRWYYTGDSGRRDDDGYFFFSARDDDVIIMAGYRIGPFDVESVLLRDPDVAEAACVGLPDALRGEVLETFVVLIDGVQPSDEKAEALQLLGRTQYAAHAYPRRVHFVASLPKTPSGKVQRFLLRT